MSEAVGAFLAASGVTRLTSPAARVFSGTYSLLHCTVGQELYRAVFAVRMLPVTHPDQFISLRYTDVTDDRVKEIGVIEDLQAFPPAERDLIRLSLAKQYHEQVITRIHEIRCQYGLLFFTVETDRGRQEFMMPWRGDRADDYGTNGKVLLDALDNRYLVPDVHALPARDQRVLTNFIYW